MSLLMQALKKAEHAKKKGLQEPAVPADSSSNFPTIEEPVAAEKIPAHIEPALPPGALTLDEPATAATIPMSDPTVQPHNEIPTTLTLETLSPKVEAPAPEPQQRFSAPAASPQQMAQNVMAASPKQGSNRMAILGVAGAVIAALCAAAVYYWQSTQNNVTALTPGRPVAVQPAVQPAVQAQQSVAPDLNPPTPGQPKQSVRAAPVPFRHPTIRSVLSTPATAGASPSGEPIQIQRNHAASQVNANLSKAYQLFMSGDTKAARPLYEAVLHEEHNNRDALLGLAAIALRQHQNEQAAALYSRLLDLDPSDPDAIAGLTSLGKGDADSSESQLKKVLAHNQQFGPALFELGNVYAQQSRWAEAQDAYFRAFASTPGNASYAFNLAISLDRLGQAKLALDYYQKAVGLGNAAPGSFNPEPARLRAAQLQQSFNTAPASH